MGKTKLRIATKKTLDEQPEAQADPSSAPESCPAGQERVRGCGEGMSQRQICTDGDWRDQGDCQCWGDGGYDQLKSSDSISIDKPVLAVSAGEEHTCALLKGGKVQCWGGNSAGQLDTGDIQDRAKPSDVSMIHQPAVALSTGKTHSCALLEDKSVQCWGESLESRPIYPLMPVQREACLDGKKGDKNRCALKNVKKISAGWSHNCALLKDGSIQCWGNNSSGQLGTGDASVHDTSIKTPKLKKAATEISSGLEHSCALLKDGSVQCWGANSRGQLGIGHASTHKPKYGRSGGGIEILGPQETLPLAGPAIALQATSRNNCVVLKDGQVQCWGSTPSIIEGLKKPVRAVNSGNGFSCALLRDGNMECWGFNSYGQLGVGDTETRETPTPVEEINKSAVAIATGEKHICALLKGGRVQCWGKNEEGQLGTGDTDPRTTPTDIEGMEQPAIAIAAGLAHTCALLEDGSVQCWGANQDGQLGTADTKTQTTPAKTRPLPKRVTAISTGLEQTCALLEDTRVICWGSNARAQLGTVTVPPAEQLVAP